MVRETRHLWVGNLPENIREDRIREHFKRYGRVQSVKLLPRGEECPVDGGSGSSAGEGTEGGSGTGSGSGGVGSTSTGSASATVAFMDIKSAAKAHATEHTLDERALTTQYYEPQHLQHRFPAHGSSEDHGSSGGGVSGVGVGTGGTGVGSGVVERGVNEAFEPRVSHGSFYGGDRVNRVVEHSTDPSAVDPGGYIPRGRPTPVSGYHVTSTRARDRLYPRTGPYATGPPPPPHLDRHRGSLPPSSWSSYESASSRYASVPPPPSPATTDAYQEESGVGVGGNSGVGSGSAGGGTLRQHKKQRRKSRSGSSSPSGSSRSGSSSSRTSRSGSSAGSTSGGSSSPGSSPHRAANAAVTEDRRPLAICVRNLPARSSDTSLKDGLFHEYKKHGKVTWVKVVGAAGDRYALVCFKKPEDVEKALEVSHDKLFFGCKIEVAPYQGYDVEDNEFRPYEAELDEYHPKATRTLFIGNLEKDVTASELRKHFEPFGEVIEIDIKKQGAVSSYAFCQYADIGSVVKAMRSMDGEHLGSNRIKLGFGKSMPTSCVWVDGIGDCVSEKYINMQFHQFGPITQVVVDRERGHALVFFEQISCAQTAVKEMRGAALRGRRLQVDFASRECQETFYEHLERQGFAGEKPWDTRPSPAATFDVTRERSFESAVTVPNAGSRFTRYETPPRARTASYSRTPGGGSTPGASPAHPTAMSRSSRRSYQTDPYYEGDYTEPAPRRFRSYDEFSQGSGASHDDYETSVVIGDSKINDDDLPPPPRRHAVQSVVTSVEPPAPPPLLLPPPDIRHLQKERVHLLEQLEECHSSGDEGFAPKKRAKLDVASTILCEDDEPEIASLLVTSHSGRKGMDVRRVSDSKIIVHHGARRGSCEGRGPGPCKRRRDTTSRHHEHHDGSRPGTPLVDERPENLVPSEPRRFRERSHEGPLSLPLPRFAAQMMNNNNTSNSNNNNGACARPSSTTIAKVASPPCATSLPSAPSPRAAPQPPASPPPRHPSPSPTSSDSETAPQSPSLEERIRSLDEKYEKWSGSRALSAAGGDALAKLDATASERFRFRHKLLDLDLNEVQPSDIVKSVLAKRSVFDEDSKRLENFNEKYEPREFTGVTGVAGVAGTIAGATSGGSGGNLVAGTGGCSGKVGLQYPFPSHPPVQSSSSGATPSTPTSTLPTPIATTMTTTPAALSTATTTCATLVTPASKTDPRTVPHNCVHPTTATPITPGTSIKTGSPELPPVTLPIGSLGSVSAASGSNFVGGIATSASLSGNVPSGLTPTLSLSASTSRVASVAAVPISCVASATIPATTAISLVSSPTTTTTTTTTTLSSSSAIIATLALVTTGSPTITTITTTSGNHNQTSTTTSTQSASSALSSASSSSSTSSISSSSAETSRTRLKKESNASSRESRESRDSKDSRDSRHSRGSKECSKSRSRKDESTEGEKNRRDHGTREEQREDRTIAPSGEITVETPETHGRDSKDTKEAKHERKEREDRERREKEERERQERRDKEERDRQERKEREERERREKDEERRERERLDKERQEKERRDREERERERKEREEFEARERERREKERLERERKEREEKDRAERREREERERKERELRLEREKQEKERLRKEREEQERREKEERERLERERRREEKERIERERKREREERERLERERRKEKEKEERERLEKEKREKEEKERSERDKHDKEKRREREDQERREKEKAAEREKRREREDKDKEKKERDESRRTQQPTENHIHLPSTPQPQVPPATPAPVTIKRRCSSQDAPPEDEAKRMKISSEHRRDSKDRPRQNRRSEDRKHRNDSHRTSRDSRESRESKESSGSIQIQENRENRDVVPQTHCDIARDPSREAKECRENRDGVVKDCRDNRENRENRDVKDSRENRENTRDNRDIRDNRENRENRENRDCRENRENRENNRDSSKDKQRSKRNRLERTEKEMRERSPRVSHELDKDFLARLELSKRNDPSPPNSQQPSVGSHHPRESSQREHHQQSSMSLHSDNDDGVLLNHEMQGTRQHPSNTDTDSDEPKKHSIFDIIDDEPAYISMYDKVKARSTKNMQKLEEEKRQVRLRDKFSQLKQRRARREEKKQSTSWDGDSVSSKALTEDEGTSESDSTRAKSLSRKGSRSRIHSDTSEEDDSFNNKLHKIKTERFHESDMDLGFADTEEKQNPTDSSSVNVVNSLHTIKKEPRSSDDEERIPLEFPSNHPSVVNNHQRDSRKKSHKKKQKRQKTSISSEESVSVSIKLEPSDSSEHKNRTNILASGGECRTNHMNDSSITTPTSTGVPTTPGIDCAEERMRQDKKQRSKKEKRRDRNGEDKMKARRKRLNRQEARDSQRMEDIFGPESDDVDESPKSTFFNRRSNLPSENNAYSDSDGGRSPILDLDRVRRKAEKKRRHQAEDENSVDLVEAGREIEAKLLGLPMSPKQTNVPCAESNDHDVFRFTDDNDSVEPSTPTTAPEKVKEKKKKRKKSKEERGRKDHHHHHHRHHHDDDNREEFDYLDYASSRASTPLARMTVSPISQDALLSPIPKNPVAVSTPAPITTSPAAVSPVANKVEKKKEKFIPGFGTDIDETIHENAVKSISEPEERDSAGRQSCGGREDSEVSAPVTPPPRTEDKPRVVISQEETEDAVAALLEETFGGSTEDFSYEGEEEEAEGDNASVPPSDAPQEDVEEMQQAVESLNASTAETDADLKPDTPQSEHDLQIDTDTEEDPNYETFDLTQPPKTPDIPSFYKSPAKTPTTAPTLIIAPEKPVENCTTPSLPVTVPVTRPPSPPTSVISHSWGLSEHKAPRELAKPSQFDAPEPEVAATGQEKAAINRCASSSPPLPPPPPQQYKQPILGPCSVPTISEAPRLSAASPRPPVPTTTAQQPLYQRLPVSPQTQMVPLRQASPRMPCVTTTSSSIAAGTISATLPSLVTQTRNPPLMQSQLSPRAPQPLSPNGQWSRGPTALNPHVSHSGKPSPPPARIPVSVPISAHRPAEITPQHIYSTAASQQPVIQHAPGMRALAPSYPRGGLPPLTLNIPPRPYMPVPPLASAIQVKNSRDSLVGKSVIETLIPVNPNSSPQRLDEPKISPAVIPETTNKASTSPKVPSPNQPPTYIPETAKIESATTSSPTSLAKVACIENSALSPRQQKQMPPLPITTENSLLSPKQKDIHANLHLLTTHTPRASTPSPVIVAHGQPHLVHKSVVHSHVPPAITTSNQSLVKTVIPVVPQQFPSTTPISVAVEKIPPIVTQATSQLSVVSTTRTTPVSQGILIVKPHVPVVSTITQSIITRVMTPTVSSISTTLCTTATTVPTSEHSAERPREPEPRFPEKQQLQQQQQPEEKISLPSPQTPQPMQLTPPVQPSQALEVVKQEEKPVVEVQKCLPLLEETKPTIEPPQPQPQSQPQPQPQQQPPPPPPPPTCEPNEQTIKIEKPEPEKIEAETPAKPIDMSDVIVPKTEPNLSPKSEPVEETIKQEEETPKERDDLDIEEESIEESIREPITDPLALDVAKEDPTDSKEDSDYWSAKEVNIESVIKKVDALCDGETNDGDANDADEDSQHEQEANGDPNDTSKGDADCWPDTESTEGDGKKDYANHDDHDEGVETCEIESPRSRRGRSKNRRGAAANRGGVTTRRGGRAAPNVGNKRGGRTSRGSKHHVEKNKLPADVYEFHDDSEEDNAGRPRLILTIKSPGPNATGPNAAPATPVAAVKEVPPEEFVSPASNTRKSRRLAEKDRSTVDDTIEDVVRGAAVNKALMAAGGVAGAHATRRSTRNNNNSGPRGGAAQQQTNVSLVNAVANQPIEPRKSPRGPRKASRRTSENNDDSSEEKSKEATRDLQENLTTKEEVETTTPVVETVGKTAEETTTKSLPIVTGQKSATLEPMTLIDPVTGMLIPMRESEEGQYIPVSSASGQLVQNAVRTTCDNRAVTNVVSSASIVSEANYQHSQQQQQQQQLTRPREPEVSQNLPTTVPIPSPIVENKKEIGNETPVFTQPPKIQIVTPIIAAQPSVITKPQSPVVQTTATAVVIQSTITPTTATMMTTTQNLVASQTTTTATSCIALPTKPTSLKAHVLNASKHVNPIVQQQPPPPPQPQQIVVNKPPIVTSLPSQPVVQNIIKQPNQAIQGLRLQIPAGRVVSPNLSPRTKPIATIGNGPNGKQGQPMSPVLNSAPGAAPNPKQHLLQAAKQQPPTIVNLPQKLPITVHPGNVPTVPVQRIHNPVTQPITVKGINGQPHLQNPKAHLLQAVVPTIVTGAIASPPTQPHIIGAQPVVTGASCLRPTNVPKPQIAGTMEPPKVEVSMSGCIMVPTASPQARGVPVVPTYEAPLHASAGAAPTPGGQYGLAPPHRSQSPPLPPPAHHHANASQSDVVNHYGGLSRAGELPPHYIHPQVLTYQYLRAQQEALTAPRIAYHVPGARSPHLPLDPKLEAGGEESHSPPLELRRATRTPQDRTTDSPQVAQVYMLHGARLPPPIAQYSPAANPPLAGAPTGPRGGYYEPPPAHIRTQYPMAGSEAPTDRAITPERPRKHQVATPPHASQVPPQADSLLMLLQRYPVMWQGLLALKNDQAAVQMHFVFGNPNVARDSLPCNSDGSTPPLRIAQRMRLEQTQLDGVARKMQTDNEHCMLLALPCGRDHMDVLQQSKNLQTGFITYLQQKQAAGIVNIPGPVSQQPAYVVHIFPSCDFANESLARIAPDLLHRVAEIAHLLIVIATV